MTSDEIQLAMAEDVARGTASLRREYGSGYAIGGGAQELGPFEKRMALLARKRSLRRLDAALKQWRQAAREAAEAPLERGPTPLTDKELAAMGVRR